MDRYELKYWLSMGVFSALIAASLQIMSVFLQESPESPNAMSTTFIIQILVMVASVLLPMSYIIHTKGQGKTFGIVLLLAGLIALAFVLLYSNAITNFFFPKTLITSFLVLDSLYVAFAGTMLILLRRAYMKDQVKSDQSLSVS
jgi:hypothetical protein